MLTEKQERALSNLNKERAEYGLEKLTAAEFKAQLLGWSLHSQKPTLRNLTSFEFRTRNGGFSRVINADTFENAVKSLTRPRV